MTSEFSRAAVITLPRLEPHRPPVSSAIIAGVCQREGIAVRSFDLNIDLFHSNRTLFDNLDGIVDGYRSATDGELAQIHSFLDDAVNRIQQFNPDIILISVFSFTTHYFAKLFLEKIKAIPAVKLIGGQGVYVPELSRQEEDRNFFGDTMLKRGLTDYYVVGEGEDVLRGFLGGKRSMPGLNNPHKSQIMDINAAPWPDYGHFDLDRYDYLYDEREVFITSSRGCVRRCTYCDVPYHWPKYRWREGENVAQEIIAHYERHGVTRFYFTDSLINGSMKSFTDMCERLAAYRFDRRIKWGGQFIIKPRNQIGTDYFDMISAAGGDQFYIGIETGSDRVRWDMDKKFTNDDIEYHLEHFSRTDLRMFFLMLTGYVTETLEDHGDTLAIFPRWQHYVADGTIKGIDLGPTLIILANTPLDHMRQELGIQFEGGDPRTWTSSVNPDLTLKERIRRRLEVHSVAMDYNWPVWRGEQRLENIRDLVKTLTDSGRNPNPITEINGAFS